MAEPRRSEQHHTDANEADEVDHRLEEVKFRRYAAPQGSNLGPSLTAMSQPLKGPQSERLIDQAAPQGSEKGSSLTTMPQPLKGPTYQRSMDQGEEIPTISSPKERSIFRAEEDVIMKSAGPSRSTAVASSLFSLPREKSSISPLQSPLPAKGEYEEQPPQKQHKPFSSPFGPYVSESGVQELPVLFHLECTNFVVKAVHNQPLSFDELCRALGDTLKQTKIDIIDFVGEHAVFDCSYHQGNRFMGLFVRVFEPPSMSSGQLLDDEETITSRIAGSLLVEVQLREGDRLYFSSLFREIQDNLKKQDGLMLTGVLRYEPKMYPAKGEGLRLDSLPDHQLSSFGMGGMYQDITEIEGSDSYESMDEDMIEDVIKLAEAHQSKYLDVQADAATAVAGLTSDAEFLNQLADPKAEKAAEALCSATARLLAETDYRPARRQAAVAVANLSTIPALCSFLLASDPVHERGIVDALVTLSMLSSREGKEEEIGTRRECMRALIEMAKIDSTKNTPPMVNLRKSKPSGKGRDDDTLMKRHRDCKSILSGNRSSVS